MSWCLWAPNAPPQALDAELDGNSASPQTPDPPREPSQPQGPTQALLEGPGEEAAESRADLWVPVRPEGPDSPPSSPLRSIKVGFAAPVIEEETGFRVAQGPPLHRACLHLPPYLASHWLQLGTQLSWNPGTEPPAECLPHLPAVLYAPAPVWLRKRAPPRPPNPEGRHLCDPILWRRKLRPRGALHGHGNAGDNGRVRFTPHTRGALCGWPGSSLLEPPPPGAPAAGTSESFTCCVLEPASAGPARLSDLIGFCCSEACSCPVPGRPCEPHRRAGPRAPRAPC